MPVLQMQMFGQQYNSFFVSFLSPAGLSFTARDGYLTPFVVIFIFFKCIFCKGPFGTGTTDCSTNLLTHSGGGDGLESQTEALYGLVSSSSAAEASNHLSSWITLFDIQAATFTQRKSLAKYSPVNKSTCYVFFLFYVCISCFITSQHFTHSLSYSIFGQGRP